MKAQGGAQSALARRIGMDPRQIRRILDLDHVANLDHIARALAALGKRLVVDVQEAA